MKEDSILDALSYVDKKYIIEADPTLKKKSALGKWYVLVASICLVVSGIFAGRHMYRTYNTEVAYICIDVNPSIEFCLNESNKVIDVCTYNEDGQKVAETLNVKNKSYLEALQILLENEMFQSYLTDEADLTFTIVSEDEDELRDGIEQCMASSEVDEEIQCTDYETRHTAHEYHCSTGKYMAYLKLSQYNKEISLEECMEMTMHEIHAQIQKEIETELQECEDKLQEYEKELEKEYQETMQEEKARQDAIQEAMEEEQEKLEQYRKELQDSCGTYEMPEDYSETHH